MIRLDPEPSVYPRASRRKASMLPGSGSALHDPRWPAIQAALLDLRERGRHAVRIVDADCGAGALLIMTAHHARALGFTAIEGLGIDGSPALIGRARAAAARASDRAIGLEFALVDLMEALRDEADVPADIVLWAGPHDGPVDAALAHAATRVITGAAA